MMSYNLKLFTTQLIWTYDAKRDFNVKTVLLKLDISDEHDHRKANLSMWTTDDKDLISAFLLTLASNVS